MKHASPLYPAALVNCSHSEAAARTSVALAFWLAIKDFESPQALLSWDVSSGSWIVPRASHYPTIDAHACKDPTVGPANIRSTAVLPWDSSRSEARITPAERAVPSRVNAASALQGAGRPRHHARTRHLRRHEEPAGEHHVVDEAPLF